MKKKIISIVTLATFLLTGCVDQTGGTTESVNVEENMRVVATSASLLTICSKLEIDLVARPSTQTSVIPAEYEELPVIGNSMAVDIEELSLVEADLIISPQSLEADLKPQYETLGVEYLFLDLTSVESLYKAIGILGEMFDKNEIAEELTAEYTALINEVEEKENKPTALVLMGLPGSYVVATDMSYVGSLVDLAGFENVYESDTEAFLNINPEDMLSREPEYIFTTAHAMPEMVYEMFEDEFKENLIWQHFDAVKNNNVHQLQHEYFGMSANFEYPKAIEVLQDLMEE